MPNEEEILEKVLKEAIDKAYKEGYKEGLKENKQKERLIRAEDAEEDKFYKLGENIYITSISVDGSNYNDEYYYFLRLKIDPDNDLIEDMRVDLIEESDKIKVINQDDLPYWLKKSMGWIEF